MMNKRNVIRTLMTLFVLSLNIFAIGSAPAIQQQPGAGMKDDKRKESPFACNVGALNAEQRKRYTALIKKLNSSKQEVKELEDGYALRFSADSSTVQELAEFIVYERLCCPFFDFELVVEREGGPAWLSLKGREGVKEFIREEFGLK
ncbi:MAG TPA: hypothetical protein VE262_24945 [Blastocatellia bacterium]|nr:hypothetical protein [Blastocatellia bacterium]